MRDLCDAQIKEKKAICEVPMFSTGFVSVTLKSAGGFRPVFNLKNLNKFIRAEHF